MKLNCNVSKCNNFDMYIYDRAEFLLDANIRQIVKRRCDLSIQTDKIKCRNLRNNFLSSFVTTSVIDVNSVGKRY